MNEARFSHIKIHMKANKRSDKNQHSKFKEWLTIRLIPKKTKRGKYVTFSNSQLGGNWKKPPMSGLHGIADPWYGNERSKSTVNMYIADMEKSKIPKAAEIEI